MENPRLAIENLPGFGPMEIIIFKIFRSNLPQKDLEIHICATKTNFTQLYESYVPISMYNHLPYKSSISNPYSKGSGEYTDLQMPHGFLTCYQKWGFTIIISLNKKEKRLFMDFGFHSCKLLPMKIHTK